ncbi:unnamed protein product, partial [marine sediment metagenome]
MTKELTIIIPAHDRKTKKIPLAILLASLKIMERKNFSVIVLNTTQNPSDQFITHIEKLVKKFKKYYPIIQFNAFDLDRLKKKLKNKWFNQFHLEGYPNFRNVALILAVLLKSETVLFLDDDEVTEDKYLTRKAIEYIGKLYKGKVIGGISGYYLDQNGSYKVSYSLFKKWWDIPWNKFMYMNRTFKKMIESKK